MALPTAEPGVYRQAFALHYPDADAAGFVRLTSILNLLQIQAGEHTQSRGFDYREHKDSGIFWVLSRLTVEVGHWPQWPSGDLTVDTWARGTKAVFALRDFRFGSGDSWFGRGSSAWVLLKDRKPQRPEPWAKIYEAVRPEEPAAEMPAALPPFNGDPQAETRAESLQRQTHGVRAGWEDIDMNGHVNNVNAVGWCLAQHDYDFLCKWRPSFLEVNFTAEMFIGQRFMVLRDEKPAPEGHRLFDYLVIRDEDQVATLRLRVSFCQ